MVPTRQEIEKFYPKISSCELFRHLSGEGLAELFKGIRFSVTKIPRGRLFAQRGAEVEALLILLEGELSADILNIEGQVLKVENLEAPTLVAAGILFSDQNFLPVQLTAVEPSVMLKIPRNDLLLLAGRDIKILEKLLNDSGNRIHFLAEKLRFMQMGTIEMKLCSYLSEQQALQKRDRIRLPYSIQILSELFGVSRPSLSRSLGALVDEGLISRDGKEVRILNEALLRQRCL